MIHKYRRNEKMRKVKIRVLDTTGSTRYELEPCQAVETVLEIVKVGEGKYAVVCDKKHIQEDSPDFKQKIGQAQEVLVIPRVGGG